MMAPILVTLWQWRRAILYGAAVAVVAWIGWRTVQYGAVKEELATVTAELAAERSCEAGSACEKRAAALALEAAQDAAVKSAEAIQGALAREEAAQREASEWRRKFRAAQQENPACADWSRQSVACPL
jgi:biopolymer transport protein ExbB/TolQ